MQAVKVAREKHLNILDVYSPFPVHGLDPILGLNESRLHYAGFIFGALGTLTAFGLMTWVFTRNWPIIFGGKPYWSVPAFIPITFELTVLFASVGMVITYYVINGQGPGINNPVLHPRITDDKFCIAFDADSMEDGEESKYRDFLSGSGAEIHTTEI